MLGNLPDQKEVRVLNGWRYAIGIDHYDEAGYCNLQCLVEKVKGGGGFGSNDHTTWERIGGQLTDLDKKAKNDGTKTKADIQAYLDTLQPILNARVGLGGGSSIPNFPTAGTYLEQAHWIVIYGITQNPTTGKFTVA